jgi:hypothetical protein
MITNPDPNGALVPRNPGGRPTKKTPRNRKLLLESIRKGTPWQLACKAVGLSTQTLENWIYEDPSLRDEIDEAEAAATMAMADDLNRLARKDGRLLLDLLKLRAPEAYGPGRKPSPQPEPPVNLDGFLRRLSGSEQPQPLAAPAPEVVVHPLAARQPVKPSIEAPRADRQLPPETPAGRDLF